jgi:hypothetical protein
MQPILERGSGEHKKNSHDMQYYFILQYTREKPWQFRTAVQRG